MSTATLQVTPDLLSLINSDTIFQPRVPAPSRKPAECDYIEGPLLKHCLDRDQHGRPAQNACLLFGMITEIMNRASGSSWSIPTQHF
jgi:hypothetical protein